MATNSSTAVLDVENMLAGAVDDASFPQSVGARCAVMSTISTNIPGINDDNKNNVDSRTYQHVQWTLVPALQIAGYVHDVIRMIGIDSNDTGL